jgi:formimidoylglutamase
MGLLGRYRFFPDPNVRWLGELVKPWDGMSKMSLAILGVPYDGGTVSHRRGSRMAPQRIREILYTKSTYSSDHGTELVDTIWDCGDIEVNIINHEETMRNIYTVAISVFRRAENTVVLGGDHSITYELGKAAAEVSGEIGLVLFDAHHDVRTEWGVHSGLWLRKLLDQGVIKGEDVIQIGIRGALYSPAYRRYLTEKKVEFITSLELMLNGVGWTLDKVFDKLAGKPHVYISFDIDAVDQAYAPGTDHPSPGGLTSIQAIYMLHSIARKTKARWLDVMEVSPPLDINEAAVKLATELVNQYIHARIGKPS